jgi:hypothetical protein
MNFFAFHVIPSVFRSFFTIWSPYMWDRADKMSIVLSHCKAGPFVSHLFAHRSLGSACGRLSSLCRLHFRIRCMEAATLVSSRMEAAQPQTRHPGRDELGHEAVVRGDVRRLRTAQPRRHRACLHGCHVMAEAVCRT